MEKNYYEMTNDELIAECNQKDSCIMQLLKNTAKEVKGQVFTKNDIMEKLHCENNKALRILKLMFQMKIANKIGKEYYVTEDAFNDFMNRYRGREIAI